MHALRLSLAASLPKSCLALLCLALLQQMEELNQLSPSLLNQADPDRESPTTVHWICLLVFQECTARSVDILLSGESLHTAKS